MSMGLKPNPIAARNLAVLSSTYEEAWPFFQEAWELLMADYTEDPAYERLTRNLVTEICFFLQQAVWYDEMIAFEKVVPDFARNLDAFLTMQTKIYMYASDFAGAESILAANCFPTYAKARDDLISMWNKVQEGLAAQAKGSELTYVEKHQARLANPVPENIGCQYAAEYCSTYW